MKLFTRYYAVTINGETTPVQLDNEYVYSIESGLREMQGRYPGASITYIKKKDVKNIQK